jgi:hypothetical protein
MIGWGGASFGRSIKEQVHTPVGLHEEMLGVREIEF